MAWRQKEEGWRELSWPLQIFSAPARHSVKAWHPTLLRPGTPHCSLSRLELETRAAAPSSLWQNGAAAHQGEKSNSKTDIPWACLKLQHYYFHDVQRSMQNFKQLTWQFSDVCRILVGLLLSKLMKADFQAKVHYKRQPSLSWKKTWQQHYERNCQLNHTKG